MTQVPAVTPLRTKKRPPDFPEQSAEVVSVMSPQNSVLDNASFASCSVLVRYTSTRLTPGFKSAVTVPKDCLEPKSQ
eukprot:Skav212182  [mRNA]  locus=scaffold754:478807:479656:+ [translate_table: standard]